MHIYKTKSFAKWAKEEKLGDNALVDAIAEMEQGNVDANLGGFVYKKRIPINGRGKRGGLRTIIAYKSQDRAIFMYGFAKSHKSNLTLEEKFALKKLASVFMGYKASQIRDAINVNKLIGVK